jgi:solute carrier family 25 phosphate transporter 3
MPLFPYHEALQQTCGSSYGRSRTQCKPNASGPTTYQARLELYPAYSAVDDAKNKAHKLSEEAAREFDKASHKAQHFHEG